MPGFSLPGASCLRAVSFLFSFYSLLYFVGCAVPSSITGKAPFSTRSGGLSIEPVVQKKTVVHPVTHPVPARLGGAEGSSMSEIPPEHFLVARVHEGQINALAVTKDGRRAFSGGQDGKVVMSTLLETRGVPHASVQGYVPAADFRPPAELIQSETILEGSKPILALTLSPDETQLLIAQYSSVAVYDFRSRQITRMLTKVKGRILAVDWDPRGELAALGRANGDVFVWNLSDEPSVHDDSFDALELYEGGSSPIVSLLFYSSGRALCVAERGGEVVIWRLLRTESELGLRDEKAKRDEARLGRLRKNIGTVGGEVEDLWLDRDGKILFAAAADGNVYRAKIRGLMPYEPITAETSVVFSIQGLDVPDGPGRYVRLLATSGKEQRIKFWCQHPEKAANRNPNGEKRVFVAQSVLLRTPATIMRSGRSSTILWAGEKTGNLLVFDANLLAASPSWMVRSEQCKD